MIALISKPKIDFRAAMQERKQLGFRNSLKLSTLLRDRVILLPSTRMGNENFANKSSPNIALELSCTGDILAGFYRLMVCANELDAPNSSVRFIILSDEIYSALRNFFRVEGGKKKIIQTDPKALFLSAQKNFF